MAKALTAKTIQAAKPSDRRQEIPDGIVKGLYLVVQPSGTKSWALRYRYAGKPVKLTLGRWPGMSLQAARIAASEALDKLARGGNPAAEKKASKAARMQAELEGRNKVASLLDQFDRRHLAKLKSREGALYYLNRFIRAPWGERDVQSITRRDVLDLLDEIADSGRGITANRVLAHLRKFLNWCAEREIIAANPAAGIKPVAPENRRDRVLSDDEIRLFWQACEAVGYPFGPLGQLLLLTGQRRGEVAQMTERELSGDTWHLDASRTKNKRPHDVPLSRAARAILAGIERIKGRHGYIFTTTGETPVSGFSRATASSTPR
jgi:integrase